MSTPASPNGSGAWPAPATTPMPRRRLWLTLVVIATAQLMIVLDATIMNIALPSAQKDLGFSLADRQWVVTAYALAFGSLLLLGGRLADLVGRKTMFLAGLIGFAAASVIGGASVNFPMLVTARAGQGIFAAVMAPAALSLLATTFTAPKDRARAFGVYGAISGAGGGVGLLLGGVLTEYLSWRWSLYVNVVFAGFAAVGGAILLGRQPRRAHTRLDLPGAALVSAGTFGIVYGFANAANHGWRTSSTWVFLATGGALLIIFTAWQAVGREPLLPLRILANRTRAGAYLSMLLAGAGMFGIMLFLNFYLQQKMGFSPVKTGLAFLPMIGMVAVVGNIATMRLLPRTGPRPLVPVGLLLSGTASALLTRLDLHSSYASGVLPSVLLMGAGLGLAFAPLVSTGVAGVPPRDTGVASATVNSGNQLGGSIGTSLLNTLFASAITTYVAAHAGPATLIHGRPSPQLMAQAAIHGYSVAFWWSAAIYAAGAVLAGVFMRSGPLPASGPATQAQPGGVQDWTPPHTKLATAGTETP